MDDHEAIEKLMKAQGGNTEPLGHSAEETPTASHIMKQMKFIGEQITNGAISFLAKEYLYLGIFSLVFAIIIGFTVDRQGMTYSGDDAWKQSHFPFTATSFLIGAGTSILSGYIGMRIAVFTNTRTTFQCCSTVHQGFLAAFRGGQVLGFCLTGFALLILQIIMIIFKKGWYDKVIADLINGRSISPQIIALGPDQSACELTRIFFEFIAGYGLGGSTVALFGRVGGGIYTKAADVGSDLVGKVLKDLKEDDPSNPGTIADNVGDNVGDIAGMGADLFGSLAESTCAALVVSSTSVKLVMTEDALYFPMMITAAGIFASFLSVLCVHLSTVTVENVQRVLKAQIGISTIFLTLLLIPCMHVLPDEFSFQRVGKTDLSVTKWQSYGCILFGLWSGMIIGFTTEFFTSNAYYPTLALANSCRQGPAPNIILGLALGYKSVIIPIICIVATIYYSFRVAGMYGIGLSALGMLGALPVALSIDGYGPISDNAGGVSEMSGLPAEIRDRTDALDAAGNTTAAVGKGFAIGSACLVGLALFGAFITRIQESSVDILEPVQFAGLLLGAMLPYAFSALTMQAVGDAAQEMIQFIVSDYKRTEEAKKKGEDATPDYAGCIGISTEASLKKMIAPGALVIISPLFVGFIFGPQATAGLLAGAIVSGVQIAISASNTGGAWDNAKKEVEKMRSALKREASKANVDPVAYAEELRDIPEDSTVPKHVEMRSWVNRFKEIREMHIAAVVGDTVGDPLKDTSGPAINILIKLSAITSLVFGSFIKEYHAVKNEDE